jgi:CRP-like cAMP-binding protein
MFLQKHPAFAGFETDGLTKILQKASFRSCKQGEIVFYEGESAENLYFIMSGKCRALKGKEGETRIVAELSAGDHFGEIALLRNRERTATIQAVTDCDLVVIEAEDFLQSLNSSLQFGLFFDQTSEERIESGQNIQRGKS